MEHKKEVLLTLVDSPYKKRIVFDSTDLLIYEILEKKGKFFIDKLN